MTTMLSLILAIMLSIGGIPAGGPGDTGIQGPIDNICTINRIFEDYSQKTASRLFPKKIPEIVLIDQPKTQIRLIFTLPLKEKLLLMGYEDSMNLYQAFNMNPINFTDPFGKDVLGACAESNKYYLYPTENKEIIEAKNRALALVGEGAANAAVKTFLLPAKYITLPARLLFGFDFDVSLNFTEEGSVVNAGIGKQNRLDIVKAQTIVYPLADFVTQTGYDAYFGLSYQGGKSPLGESSRENLARSAGALEFNTLFWGNVSKSIMNQRQATANSISGQENINITTQNNYVPESLLKGKADAYAYLGVRNKEPVYTGVTNDPIRRASQHADRFRLRKITENPLTRRQARAIEQVIIENNPQFENIINSIGKYRSWYDEAVTWGEKWLIENGFKWLLK